MKHENVGQYRNRIAYKALPQKMELFITTFVIIPNRKVLYITVKYIMIMVSLTILEFAVGNNISHALLVFLKAQE
jgi:hypothetical protein